MTLVPPPPEPPVDGEPLDAENPHAVTRTEYPWGIAVVCACGRWECVVTGPSSAAWAEADHRRHVLAETAPDA